MHPRTEVGVALGILAVLAAGAAALGSRRQTADDDPRRSTFVAGPRGARGYADALGRLGVGTERLRLRTSRLDALEPGGSALLAVLEPEWLASGDAAALAAYRARGHDLLLAGQGARAAMRCFGYDALERRDSAWATAYPPEREARSTARAARVGVVMVPWYGGADTAGFEPELGASRRCSPVRPERVDTLLLAANGWPAAVRLRFASGGAALLVADGGLFANRALRDTPAGELALGLVVGRYRRVLFDESVHGFGAGGSLARALGGWIRGSPWGWALVQLAGVGVLALLASGIRFGPSRSVIERQRRSPLEHLRALAVALAAARGQALAVRLLVQGLRRRLAGPGAPAAVRGDPGPWLDAIAPELTTPRARAAAAQLRQLIARPTRDASVLEAAIAVEDVWEELKP